MKVDHVPICWSYGVELAFSFCCLAAICFIGCSSCLRVHILVKSVSLAEHVASRTTHAWQASRVHILRLFAEQRSHIFSRPELAPSCISLVGYRVAAATCNNLCKNWCLFDNKSPMCSFSENMASTTTNIFQPLLRSSFIQFVCISFATCLCFAVGWFEKFSHLYIIIRTVCILIFGNKLI